MITLENQHLTRIGSLFGNQWCLSGFLVLSRAKLKNTLLGPHVETKELFSQFIKSQNIAKSSTAARCALLAAVFSLLFLSCIYHFQQTNFVQKIQIL